MASLSVSPFLSRVLVADGIISGAAGVLMLFGAGVLQDTLGMPVSLLRYAGLSLIPFAALVVELSKRDSLPRLAVWSVIALNAAWVAGSVLVLWSGLIEPNAFGSAFILAQALAVAVFAELQYVGMRRSVVAAC